MHRTFMRPQIQFIFKNDESCLETLSILAEEMLQVKMTLQGRIMFEILVGDALFIANMATIVILVQVSMQFLETVKSRRLAKFTNRMTHKTTLETISFFHVILKLKLRISGKLGNEITLMLDTKVTELCLVFRFQVVKQELIGRFLSLGCSFAGGTISRC